MPDYLKTAEIEQPGYTLHVTACDPEFDGDDRVETCTVRASINGGAEQDGHDMDGAAERAVEVWLNDTYYPWALECAMNDALDDAAEALFEGRAAYDACYGPGDADYR